MNTSARRAPGPKPNVSFAATVADTIARVYGEYEYRHAETALESYQQHLMELHRMEALGRMAAGVAHDFRGIVGIALGFAELIRRVPNLGRKPITTRNASSRRWSAARRSPRKS